MPAKRVASLDVRHAGDSYHEGPCTADCAALGPVERISVACACLEPHGPCTAAARAAEKAIKALLPKGDA